MIGRRKLIFGLALIGLAAPLISFPQTPGKVWRIGFLSILSHRATVKNGSFRAFMEEMRALGYVEGKNLVVEVRLADGKSKRLPALAAELVRLNVDVIVAAGAAPTRAAQKATTTIPIVTGGIGDPVATGFVTSLARPGGNITGFTLFIQDLIPKQLELLNSLMPKLARVGVLLNPSSPSYNTNRKVLQALAQRTAVKVFPTAARTPQELEKAFLQWSQDHAGAVIVVADPIFSGQVRHIADLAAKYRLGSIYAFRNLPEAGGLMSYGANIVDVYRRAAAYVDKILKGAKPADLPIERPTTFELVINRRTVKKLGLEIPQELRIRAEEVIE